MPDQPTSPGDKTQTTPGPGEASLLDSRSARAFPPGSVFAGRYQIVSSLGRGGMGLVYRAEDLKLGHPVALKFLPQELLQDPVMLQYLCAEVRNTRQVSHPNVCRVYDIGEHEGRHFLSMEYVDGEDLASLVRRIGRLPAQKALEISREICAGLAAAHDRGVVHRDLKPANIMIDGRGQARLMDFGLALKAAAGAQTEEFAGTPAYMSPEQLAGQGASLKSDIYSLGLVLYELFTGHRVFEASNIEELRRKQMTETPRPPSSYAPDIDPGIDRVIMRCLAREPSARPASALEVATALPGGDLLRAALAAGRTPTPEMVAAAGAVGSLKPSAAWGLLALFAACLASAVILAPRSMLLGQPDFRKSPEVLAEEAHKIIESLGYKDPPRDTNYWFEADDDLINWMAGDGFKTMSPLQKKELRTRQVRFRYRQSPRRLIPDGNQGLIKETNPPVDVPGMISVDLDPRGRLLRFLAVPSPLPILGESPAVPDWSVFFTAAGLDDKNLAASPLKVLPSVPFDNHASWTISSDQGSGVSFHVIAASSGGKSVYFEVAGPWGDPGKTPSFAARLSRSYAPDLWFFAVLSIGVFGVYFARRNIRMRRGDRRGALRLAALAFALAAGWILWSHHAYASLADFMWWIRGGLAFFLFDAGFVWVSYIAAEPTMRRHWPDQLISWNRILAGRFRDPLVGRDVLIGSILGAALAAVMFLLHAQPGWMFLPGAWSAHIELQSLLGATRELGMVCYLVGNTVFFGMGWIWAAIIPQILFRRKWVTITIFLLFGTINLLTGFSGDLKGQIVLGLIMSAVCTFSLFRIGIFSAINCFFIYNILTRMPLRLDIQGWSARAAVMTLMIAVGVAVYGFYVALGGNPVFGRFKLEE